MNSFIDDLLPKAINVLSRETNIKEGNSIKGIYESYLSQFGPMASQIGMRSTIAVYFNKDTSTNKGDRKIILKLIFKLIHNNENSDYKIWTEKILKDEIEINTELENKILDASVALKRAIRTFELTDKSQND